MDFICEKLNLKKFDLSKEEKKRIENTGPKLSSSTELKFNEKFYQRYEQRRTGF